MAGTFNPYRHIYCRSDYREGTMKQEADWGPDEVTPLQIVGAMITIILGSIFTVIRKICRR